MTIHKWLKTYEKEYKCTIQYEVYKFNSNRHSIHTDFITQLQGIEYNLNDNVIAHELMDEEEYNKTICANCSCKFSDYYNKEDKVLILIINN